MKPKVIIIIILLLIIVGIALEVAHSKMSSARDNESQQIELKEEVVESQDLKTTS